MPYARGANASPLDAEIQTGEGPQLINYGPLAVCAIDAAKAGVIRQRMLTAKIAFDTGLLPAGAYTQRLFFCARDATIRVHRVQAYALDGAGGAGNKFPTPLPLTNTRLHYFAGRGPLDIQIEQAATPKTFTAEGMAGGAGPNVGGLPLLQVGGAQLAAGPVPQEIQDVLVDGAPAGLDRITYDNAEGLIVTPGVPADGGVDFAGIAWDWQRTAALNDVDLGVLIVSYSILAEGMWPER